MNHFKPLSKVVERLDYHPEGNTLIHTKLVALRATHLVGDRSVIAAAVWHDVCKAHKYGGEWKEYALGQYWSNPNHAKQAHELILSDDDIRYWIYQFGADIDTVLDIVRCHMSIKNGVPKKYRSIPFIEEFAMCDDMVHRRKLKSHVWGYHGKYAFNKVYFAGLSKIDIWAGCKTYTITIGRYPIRKSMGEIGNDLPPMVSHLLC